MPTQTAFQSVPGNLWCVKVTVEGESKNLFLTAPSRVKAIEQAKALSPSNSSFKVEEAIEAEYILCAAAPVTTTMWVPKKP
jgi:hypothetical protein